MTWSIDSKDYYAKGWASLALENSSDYWYKNAYSGLDRIVEYKHTPPTWIPIVSDSSVPRNQAYVFKESDFKITKQAPNPIFLNPEDYQNLQQELNHVNSKEMQGWFPMIPIYPEADTVEIPVEQPYEHLDTSARLEATRQDGMSCIRCKEVSQYAEANQEDGSFKCYPCRTYEFRPGLK